MVIITCCCGTTLKRGSFISGFFSLGLNIIVVATGSFHLNADTHSPEPVVVFSFLILLINSLCVLTSILLLIGLCVDCRKFLLPWILTVCIATVLDLILSFYLLSETYFDAVILTLFVLDMCICALNVYCIICVISQYQVYSSDRSTDSSHLYQYQPHSDIVHNPTIVVGSETNNQQQLSDTSSKPMYSSVTIQSESDNDSNKLISFTSSKLVNSTSDINRVSLGRNSAENEQHGGVQQHCSGTVVSLDRFLRNSRPVTRICNVRASATFPRIVRSSSSDSEMCLTLLGKANESD